VAFLEDFRELRSAISGEKAEGEYFRKKRKIRDCSDPNWLIKNVVSVTKSAPARAGTEPRRVIVVGDTCVGEDFIAPQIADKLPEPGERIP
jgi:hypothetical protein